MTGTKWSNWRGALVGALLVLGTLAVYWPVTGYDFTNYDDPLYVTDNPLVKAGLTWNGLGWAFTTGHASNWHPLTWLSLMLDSQLCDMKPGGFHLTNILFHAANTLLLFLVLRRMTGAFWRSVFVAALFALHPLHVESVAWVAERKDVLSTLFFLLALGAYVRYARKSEVRSQKPEASQRLPASSLRPLTSGYYWLALFFFAGGLMSKPMLVTLPFVLLLLDYWPLNRFQLSTLNSPLSTLARLILEKTPFFLLSAASSVVTYLAQEAGEAVARTALLPITLRIGNAFISYVRYLGKTFWPADLAAFYPHPDRWPVWQVVLAATFVVTACVVVLRLARRLPFLATGWFWFLGMLIPVIGLVQVGGQSMADRYTYLPLIGVFIVLSWGAAQLFGQWRLSAGLVGCMATVTLGACALISAGQLRHWRNGETLFRHAALVTKNNFIAWNNLGTWFLEQGQLEKALASFQSAFQVVTGDAAAVGERGSAFNSGQPPPLALVTNAAHVNVLDNLGVTLARMGHEKEATPYFRRALELKPNDVDFLNNLGQALRSQNQLPDALACFEKALRLQPDYGKARINLANGLLSLGRLDEAIEQYQLVLRQCPDCGDAHTPLGIALGQKGRHDEAIAQFQEAVRLSPNLASAHNNLGNALADRGRNKEAAREYREALRLQPDSPQAHLNLGILLEQLGRRDEAVQHLKEALRLNPGNAQLKQHLRALGVALPE